MIHYCQGRDHNVLSFILDQLADSHHTSASLIQVPDRYLQVRIAWNCMELHLWSLVGSLVLELTLLVTQGNSGIKYRFLSLSVASENSTSTSGGSKTFLQVHQNDLNSLFPSKQWRVTSWSTSQWMTISYYQRITLIRSAIGKALTSWFWGRLVPIRPPIVQGWLIVLRKSRKKLERYILTTTQAMQCWRYS